MKGFVDPGSVSTESVQVLKPDGTLVPDHGYDLDLKEARLRQEVWMANQRGVWIDEIRDCDCGIEPKEQTSRPEVQAPPPAATLTPALAPLLEKSR